jgi:hypothetical protein
MLQVIKKIFFQRQAQGKSFRQGSSTSLGRNQGSKKKVRDEKFIFAKNFDGAKQLKEMGKLGGKLILM